MKWEQNMQSDFGQKMVKNEVVEVNDHMHELLETVNKQHKLIEEVKKELSADREERKQKEILEKAK